MPALAAIRDERAKAILIADHLAVTVEPDRRPTLDLLMGKLRPRTVRLALIRGLAEARLDPVLFELAHDYTGDLAETIALIWPARRGANKDPSLGELIECLSTLGRSELPKRLEAWLDAADANGRWAIIKLATGTLRTDGPPPSPPPPNGSSASTPKPSRWRRSASDSSCTRLAPASWTRSTPGAPLLAGL